MRALIIGFFVLSSSAFACPGHGESVQLPIDEVKKMSCTKMTDTLTICTDDKFVCRILDLGGKNERHACMRKVAAKKDVDTED